MTPRLVNRDFRCSNCGNYILVLPSISAVNNRNHCPYCLWSRHLDLVTAGDRLSACKAPMQPLGLTMKPGRNRYAQTGGELMLVHACVGCSRLSINRIAADDDADRLLEIFFASCKLPPGTRGRFLSAGIRLLKHSQAGVVQKQLLGNCTLSFA